MARLLKEDVDRFFDSDVHLSSRTIYLRDGDEGGIDSVVSTRVIKGLRLLEKASSEPISLVINSFGGCWFNGMAIYDAINHCGCLVNAYVLGSAMSMGSVILQAADSRVIYPHATIMIHDGYDSVNDISQNFYNWAEYSKTLKNQMYKIYASRTGRTVAFWRRKCAHDFIVTADEALNLGLVDAVYGQ